MAIIQGGMAMVDQPHCVAGCGRGVSVSGAVCTHCGVGAVGMDRQRRTINLTPATRTWLLPVLLVLAAVALVLVLAFGH